jgi:hypothetical protein
MKMKRYASFDEYLADQSPGNQAIIRPLRRLVKRVAPQLEEAVKWGNGCWLNEREPIAYVYSAPDHVQFGFVMGSTLKDANGLLHGDGAFVRHIKVFKRSDIDARSFGDLLLQASKKKRPIGRAAKSARRK